MEVFVYSSSESPRLVFIFAFPFQLKQWPQGIVCRFISLFPKSIELISKCFVLINKRNLEGTKR